MTLDMTQFHPIFFDETAEHLATMEALLLHLDPQDPDPEHFDDLVRAAHSIKGSGSTFGFRDMANLAEAVEALVTGVRKGGHPLSGELLGALREAIAVLRAQLAGYRGEGVVAADAAARATALLREVLQGRPDARRPPRPQAVPAAAAPAPAAKAPPPEAPDLAAAAVELRELAHRTTLAGSDVMALIEAAGVGGMGEVTAAVRELGEAIERNAALVEQAVENAASLRESFRGLVRTIAVLALAPPAGRSAPARPARPHPLPKVRRASATAGDDKEWPEF